MTTAPVARLTGAQRALFCSDIHLDASEPALASRFLDELAQASHGVSHLFVLGDLFEAWVGDDQTDAVAERLHGLLIELLARGVQIFLAHGNRDFLMGVSAHTGRAARTFWDHITLLPEESVLDLFGEAVLLAHGDGYCTDDLRYQQFRARRNQPAWRSEFLTRPLEVRQELARQMRAQSELEKANKAQYLMDVNPAAIQTAMDRAGVRCLIHGHTHRPAHHQWRGRDRTLHRWVLPDWQLGSGRGGFLQATECGYQKLGNWENGTPAD